MVLEAFWTERAVCKMFAICYLFASPVINYKLMEWVDIMLEHRLYHQIVVM